MNLSKLTTNTAIISSNAIVAEIQPVTVDHSVLDKMEHVSDLFGKINIATNLTPEQDKELKVCIKHKDVLFMSDIDIGKCSLIKHRIDVLDDVPFKQKHRYIPP